MKKLMMASAVVVMMAGMTSCGEQAAKNTPPDHNDTAVMQPSQTDSATNTISTDTTKK